MTATFQGIGTLQFTPDNKHAFAYAPETNAPSGGGTALEFETQSYYLICKLTVGSINDYINNVEMKLLLDDVVIFDNEYGNTAQEYNTGTEPYRFIIPPFTKFTLTFENESGGGSSNWHAMLMADVKGTIEQFDLEVKE